MSERIYQVEDRGIMRFADNGKLIVCPIKVLVGDEQVTLHIGNRKWQWNAVSGDLLSLSST